MQSLTQDLRKNSVQGRRGYACTFCRRRKFKCDGRSPCRSCTKANQTCSYDNAAHRTPTQLLQDRIDELQSKIATIESRGKAPSRTPKGPSRSTYSPQGYNAGPYVQFSPNEYSTPEPSHYASNFQYGADYVASECSSSTGSSGAIYAQYPQTMTGSTCRNSPSAAWDTPYIESDSPRMLDSQSMLGRDNVITESLSDTIMFSFLTHRFRCGLLHIDRLQPDTLNAERHPALLSAAYLFGCFFCPDGSLTHLEPMFVERTRRALEDAIDLTENPSYAVDYLLAGTMLSAYYYSKGRLLEGYHRGISAMRFAVNKGFHELKPVPRDPISMQDPMNRLELFNQKDKVFIWWLTFWVDRWGSLLTGLPAGIADGDIRTPWLQSLDDIIDDVHTNSVSSLYSPMPVIPDRTSSPHYGYLVKSLALLDRTSVKASNADAMSPEEWQAEHATIQMALSRFAESLGPIRESQSIQDGAVLAFVHTYVYATTCTLHMPYIRQWARDETKVVQRNRLRSICRDAASTASAILHQQRETIPAMIPVWQGLPIAAICEYLLQERDDLIDELEFTEQAEIDRQLDEMMGWMHEMRSTFPLLGMQVDKLEAARRP